MTGRAQEAIYGVQSRMADTWCDRGMTLDNQWQKIHRIQIVEWDREGRRVATRTRIGHVARVRTRLGRDTDNGERGPTKVYE